MSNFKSGSGNLDFGENDDTESETSETTTTDSDEEVPESTTTESESSPSGSRESSPAQPDEQVEQATADQQSDGESNDSSQVDQYPYFIRRSNVGDERDTRLEIHVRDKVANQESEFRNELANRLGSNEISKTDAREFALLAAFENPKQVAELMEEEGFGALD